MTGYSQQILFPHAALDCYERTKMGQNYQYRLNLGSNGRSLRKPLFIKQSRTSRLTKALALELAEYNITVNTINPGWVDTELGGKSIEESEFTKEELLDCIPQKRFVKPEEVAKLCKYLISDDAKGITGQGINLCAGLSVGI